jgi:regulator of replication initiation timing
MPKTTATDILNAVNMMEQKLTTHHTEFDSFRELVTKYCTESNKQMGKLHTENTNLRRRVNGIGKLVQSLVNKSGKHSNETVSPPPGRERTRKTSNETVSSLESMSDNDNDTKIKKYTELPCKPSRGEIWLSALIDGWLLHGNTFSLKDLIKAHGGHFCKPMKGWVFTDKDAISRVIKRISLGVHTEKIKNTLEGIGYVPYKPDGDAPEPKVLRDGHVVNENKAALEFLGSSSKNGDKDSRTTRCLIEDSDDEEDSSDGNVSVSESDSDDSDEE